MKRCPRCQLCPKPEDFEYFWGTGATDEPLCQNCRRVVQLKKEAKESDEVETQRKPIRYAIVVIVEKLYELPARLMDEHSLTRALRETLKLREYGKDCFITDGTRLWRWTMWPGNAEKPLDWELFCGYYHTFEMYEQWGASIREVQAQPVTTAKQEESPNVTYTPVPFDHILM